MQAHQFDQAIRDYRRLRTLVPLGTLRTKKDHARAVEMLDAILDEIGEDEKHPMAELADAISVFIEKYEDEHVPVSQAKPSAALKFLMREHGLRQSDLPEIGSQGVVSEILVGKRELNARQIKRLAKRFSVSPAVFI
ncbi:MAG: helix-turn-helix domain-containing protein [Sulfuricaulis sp.]